MSWKGIRAMILTLARLGSLLLSDLTVPTSWEMPDLLEVCVRPLRWKFSILTRKTCLTVYHDVEMSVPTEKTVFGTSDANTRVWWLSRFQYYCIVLHPPRVRGGLRNV